MPNFVDISNYSNSANYQKLYGAKTQEIILYGGASAGKSYEVCAWLLQSIIKWDQLRGVPTRSLLIRKTLPALKRSIKPIFDKQIERLGMAAYSHYNKTEMAYNILHSTVECLSCNSETETEKIKSITDVDFIIMEESTELSAKIYEVVMTRLRGGGVPDVYKRAIQLYNPVSVANWTYAHFFERNCPEITKIRVNIDDNRFEAADGLTRKRLLGLRDRNRNLYNVYYLGEYGNLEGMIYEGYEVVPDVPRGAKYVGDGIDFGYNAPSAHVRCWEYDGMFYADELLYQSGLTNTELIQLSKKNCIIGGHIYADSAEPDRIKEFQVAGLRCDEASKSIRGGIDYIKSRPLRVTARSVNLIKELQGYYWARDRHDNPTDEPVGVADHALDAMRYGFFTPHANTGKRLDISVWDSLNK